METEGQKREEEEKNGNPAKYSLFVALGWSRGNFKERLLNVYRYYPHTVKAENSSVKMATIVKPPCIFIFLLATGR